MIFVSIWIIRWSFQLLFDCFNTLLHLNNLLKDLKGAAIAILQPVDGLLFNNQTNCNCKERVVEVILLLLSMIFVEPKDEGPKLKLIRFFNLFLNFASIIILVCLKYHLIIFKIVSVAVD